MIRLHAGEEFKEVKIEYPLKRKYAVSNYGRLISYEGDQPREGRILKGAFIEGYKTLRYKKFVDGKVANRQLFIHKVVAELFLEKTAADQEHVIHLDFDLSNNYIGNLRWVNYEDRLVHYRKSPNVIRAKQKLIEHNIKADGHKLTTTSVIRLKKMINDPNRKTRLKLIAKQFGISEMQLYRIKSGENWGHVKV